MKLSLTSTSISSELMSTIVQMPVRVKPPADIGEIISPGCAFLVVTTPANGARMIVSSSCCFHSSTWRSATTDVRRLPRDAGFELTHFGLRLGMSDWLHRVAVPQIC